MLLLNGNKVAEEIYRKLAPEVANIGGNGVTLATVIVGDYAPSRLYVNLKQKKAKAVGMKSRMVELPGSILQTELEDRLRTLAADTSVHGILLQLPLPDGLNTRKMLDCIPLNKDVDGLGEKNLGKLLIGENGLAPCTPLGVLRMLQYYQITISGKQAVIVGRSTLVGLPLSLLLARKGIDATVKICHSRTPNLAEQCREADILVAAVGNPAMVRADWVKPGASVIDVGVTQVGKKIQGDVDFDGVSKVAGALSPMPGGTGPLTVACLIENTLCAYHLQQH